jgi:hypothetical protein
VSCRLVFTNASVGAISIDSIKIVLKLSMLPYDN